MAEVSAEERARQIRERESFREEMAERLRQKAEAAKRFNIADIITDGEKERLAYVELIDRSVPYKVLNVGDERDLSKYADPEEHKLRKLHLWLSKADPSITYEQVKAMPTVTAGAIFNAIQAQRSFLPPA